MKQNEVSLPLGSRKQRKRVGRGNGSGHGTYSGRGCKGQKSRSGGGVRPNFEGGQLPLSKRLPEKRGFTNIFKTKYNIINIGQLNNFTQDTEVTPERLLGAGLVKSVRHPIKILGDGELDRSLVVKAHKFSTTAIGKIKVAGGKAVVLKSRRVYR